MVPQPVVATSMVIVFDSMLWWHGETGLDTFSSTPFPLPPPPPLCCPLCHTLFKPGHASCYRLYTFAHILLRLALLHPLCAAYLKHFKTPASLYPLFPQGREHVFRPPCDSASFPISASLPRHFLPVCHRTWFLFYTTPSHLVGRAGQDPYWQQLCFGKERTVENHGFQWQHVYFVCRKMRRDGTHPYLPNPPHIYLPEPDTNSYLFSFTRTHFYAGCHLLF